MNNRSGFTLVELAMVMIIIGLLIGGVFGGMALIENMKINSVVQQLKNVESSALKFKDAYGLLPGDIHDPGAVLSDCTAAPCTTAGNGDGKLDISAAWTNTLTSASERFVFWQHLLAAKMVENIQPTTSLVFGEGQPLTALETGLRLGHFPATSGLVGGFYQSDKPFHVAILTNTPDAALSGATIAAVLNSKLIEKLDRKIDDGFPLAGRMNEWGPCFTGPASATSTYTDTGECTPLYIYNF